MKKILSSFLMINVLGLVACASSSPEPETAAQANMQSSTNQESQPPSEQADQAVAVHPQDQTHAVPPKIADNAQNLPNSTDTDPLQPSQTNSAPLPSQTNSAPLQPSQTNSAPLPSQANSAPLPSQTNSALLPTQTNSAPLPSQTGTAPQSSHVLDTLPPQTDTQDLIPAIPPESIDYAAVRKAELTALRNGESTDFTEFWAAIDNDPLMTVTLYDEVKPHGTNSLSALGGGSTVSLKYTDSADETVKAAIKPDQDLRQTMYRSEIAYYRLCQILECSYDVPITRPVRFSHDDFYELYDVSNSKKNKNYRSKFTHLLWEDEYGSKFLYAAYKEWISPFDFFPIEVTSAWSPYLKNPDREQPELDNFIRTLLASARPDSHKSNRKYLEYLEGKTTRDILHQISDMILIDYLTNNWDRFSGSVDNYGANCHIQPGGLIAIDNGAAFPPWHAPRVVRRLKMVETFSRTLVTNLRLIDTEELLARLFPNPTREELKSLERFRERHADALKYIDKLIAEKGEENVLVFD